MKTYVLYTVCVTKWFTCQSPLVTMPYNYRSVSQYSLIIWAV